MEAAAITWLLLSPFTTVLHFACSNSCVTSTCCPDASGVSSPVVLYLGVSSPVVLYLGVSSPVVLYLGVSSPVVLYLGLLKPSTAEGK